MLTIAKYLTGISIWGASLFGTLQLYEMDLGLGHGICGRWGCGPTVEALLGYHGFWMVLILPLALLLGLVLSNSARRSLGTWMLVGGILAAVAYMICDGVLYYGRVHTMEFSLQRALFSLAVAVDLPMLQVALAGLCLRSRWLDKSPLEVAPSHRDCQNA